MQHATPPQPQSQTAPIWLPEITVQQYTRLLLGITPAQAADEAQTAVECAQVYLDEALTASSCLFEASDTEEFTDIIKTIADSVQAIEAEIEDIKHLQTASGTALYFPHEIEQCEQYRAQAIATQNSATYYYHMLTEINEL
jgi:uncharacterized circularly permuted ATP-grasp superfamily protein